MNPYRAPAWLPGGNAQTLYPLLIKPPPLAYVRERWETPDGDFIDLDWSPGRAQEPGLEPLVVLFHGLEGSSGSHYALALMHALRRLGRDGVVIHFRGCSGEPNRLARAYHSGDSQEIDWILRRLRGRQPKRGLQAVGVSLGGNALLKWLGESGESARDVVETAAAISAPLDLAACGHHLGRGFNRVYSRHFLKTLKPAAAAKLVRYPGLFDESRLKAAQTLFAFDDLVTGPLHGFSGAEEYWLRASSKPWLSSIRLPTLILNARNDPFLPASALPAANQVAPAVTLEISEEGGHVGFTSGPFPGTLDWLPDRILRFFT